MSTTFSMRLSLLGAPRFEQAGKRVPLSAAKPIALLGYLALSTVPQRREQVLDLLWPDSSLDAGRKNLRNVLWVVRRALGDGVLSTASDYLALADGAWTDVRALEMAAERPAPHTLGELHSIVALYRGPLLDGLVLDASADFELWLTGERERLGQLYFHTLGRLVEMHRAAKNWTEVIALARRGLRLDPLQESLAQVLMEAHARRGERSDALRQYETLRALLARELEVEPLPETQTLRWAIARGELRPAQSSRDFESGRGRRADGAYMGEPVLRAAL